MSSNAPPSFVAPSSWWSSRSASSVFEPVIASNRCAVILDRSVAYGWNNAMDITPMIVEALDRKLPAVQFNLAPP